MSAPLPSRRGNRATFPSAGLDGSAHDVAAVVVAKPSISPAVRVAAFVGSGSTVVVAVSTATAVVSSLTRTSDSVAITVFFVIASVLTLITNGVVAAAVVIIGVVAVVADHDGIAWACHGSRRGHCYAAALAANSSGVGRACRTLRVERRRRPAAPSVIPLQLRLVTARLVAGSTSRVGALATRGGWGGVPPGHNVRHSS